LYTIVQLLSEICLPIFIRRAGIPKRVAHYLV